jgi:D-alanine-D-alanine ligase
MRMIVFSSEYPEIYGGSKPEEYRRMIEALKKAGIEAVHKFVTTERQLIRDIEEYKPDLIFAAIDHTVKGDGRRWISPILERMGIPYVGSDPLGLSNAFSKTKTKRIWTEHGINSPDFFLLESPSDADEIPLESYPLIVKPLEGGGSRGITEDNVVFTREQLRKLLRRLLSQTKAGLFAERYIEGREFTVPIMGNGKGRLIMPSELVPQRGVKPIVITHQIKEGLPGTRPVEPEPVIEGPLRERLAEFAGRMSDSCALRDYGRADIIMDDRGELHAIELNAQPVFESYYLRGFRAAGMDYDAAVNGVIYASVLRWRAEGRDVPIPPLIREVLPPEILRRLSGG